MRFTELLCATDKGIYCPPGDFHIDPTRPVPRALITHGHSDHARSGHGSVLATAETLKVMAARYGEDFAGSTQVAHKGDALYFDRDRLLDALPRADDRGRLVQGVLRATRAVLSEHSLDALQRQLVAAIADGCGPDFVDDYYQNVYGGWILPPDFPTTMAHAEVARPSDLPKITQAMARRGFAEDDIRKILGENVLRVLREVMGVPA